MIGEILFLEQNNIKNVGACALIEITMINLRGN
jgi:hypothetical protein